MANDSFHCQRLRRKAGAKLLIFNGIRKYIHTFLLIGVQFLTYSRLIDVAFGWKCCLLLLEYMLYVVDVAIVVCRGDSKQMAHQGIDVGVREMLCSYVLEVGTDGAK